MIWKEEAEQKATGRRGAPLTVMSAQECLRNSDLTLILNQTSQSKLWAASSGSFCIQGASALFNVKRQRWCRSL